MAWLSVRGSWKHPEKKKEKKKKKRGERSLATRKSNPGARSARVFCLLFFFFLRLGGSQPDQFLTLEIERPRFGLGVLEIWVATNFSPCHFSPYPCFSPPMFRPLPQTIPEADRRVGQKYFFLFGNPPVHLHVSLERGYQFSMFSWRMA